MSLRERAILNFIFRESDHDNEGYESIDYLIRYWVFNTTILDKFVYSQFRCIPIDRSVPRDYYSVTND